MLLACRPLNAALSIYLVGRQCEFYGSRGKRLVIPFFFSQSWRLADVAAACATSYRHSIYVYNKRHSWRVSVREICYLSACYFENENNLKINTKTTTTIFSSNTIIINTKERIQKRRETFFSLMFKQNVSCFTNYSIQDSSSNVYKV